MTDIENISSAELVQKLLISAEILSSPVSDPVKPWPLFLGNLPEDPDNAALVFNMGGTRQGRSMRTGKVVEFPGVQFRIRGSDYKLAYDKAKRIATFIDEVHRNLVTIGELEFRVNSVSRLNSVTDIGIDSSSRRRSLFTFSATVSAEIIS